MVYPTLSSVYAVPEVSSMIFPHQFSGKSRRPCCCRSSSMHYNADIPYSKNTMLALQKKGRPDRRLFCQAIALSRRLINRIAAEV